MTFLQFPSLRRSSSAGETSSSSAASSPASSSGTGSRRHASGGLTEPLLRQRPAAEPEGGEPPSPAPAASAPHRNARLRGAVLRQMMAAERTRAGHRLAQANALPGAQARHEARTQANLTTLARQAVLQARLNRVQRDAYVARLKEVLSTDQFQHPMALKGAVGRGPDQRLASPDKAIQAVLDYVQAKHPQEAARLDLQGATELRLPLEADILLNAWEFSTGCKVREIHLADGGTEEADIDLSTYAAREAIKKGATAFGEEARLRPVSLKDVEPSSDAEDAHLTPAPGLEGNPEKHPFAFLQGVRYRAESDHEGLQTLVNRCLGASDPVTLELRGRMGAQAVNAVLTQKQFTPALGWSMLASLVGSGGLAYALDVVAWGAVMGQVSAALGEDHPATRMTEVLLASLTPLFAETVDSLVIKRLLGTFQNEPLLPESFAEFMDDLKDSAISGTIAAVGSIPNNVAGLTQRWAMEPVSMVTNQIAVSTSGAMVPREVAAAHGEMATGVLERMNEGFFPAPGVAPAAGASEAQARRALADHALADTQGALEAAPGHGLAINSMGIGSVISLLTGFLPFDTMARAHVLPAVVQKIVTIMVNTPTEVLSLGVGILTGNHLGGIGGKLTTDAEKNRRIIELIAHKAVERLGQAQSGGTQGIEITEAELRAIEHPSLALTFPAGRTIVNTMNGVADMVSRCWGALRGVPGERPGEQVDVSSLMKRMESQDRHSAPV
ncbi:hypothetical protein [Paracidovorax cattleyae]|uniref:Uncharacterized protein n=1 Tax=Paracidovorax cattleyae TaxID=80868 RepID=A0A1H0WUZ2_9BURK|nr:hypothetical protein [Paracidovorax cattleyae]SDP94275.1 hypothetical protein SAMN04489708_1615 [Paracidovorax cattleyae]